MRATLLLLLTMSLASFFSCKSTYSPDTYEKPQIRFGSGGGFTGAVTEYCLLSSGQLFLKEHKDTTFTEIGKITKSEAKELFAEALEKKLPTKKMKDSYNMYKFLTYKTKENSNDMIWGVDDGTNNKGGEMAGFHRKLMDLIAPKEQSDM